MSDPPAPSTTDRDPFVDFVRAASLVVVVIWHWAFTVLRWEDDGPHTSNPIGFTHGLWLLTWVLQVMPLFFFVGGAVNLRAFHRAQQRGGSVGRFVAGRLRQLLVPAFALIAVWWTALIVIGAVVDWSWLRGTIMLILSPLWFAFSYALIILLFPAFHSLHQRYGYLVPVWLAGIAAVVDIARFAHRVPYVGWVNMIVVWGLAHQLGFFYTDLARAPRRAHQAMAWGGAFFLAALVWSRAYPGSMVGVPGDKFSNMAPPSLAIVALVILQVGLLFLVRPWVESRLARPGWQRPVAIVTRVSMPLYLLHSSGLAIFLTAGYFINHEAPMAATIDGTWWLMRPLAIALPLITTLPLVWAVSALQRRSASTRSDAVGHDVARRARSGRPTGSTRNR